MDAQKENRNKKIIGIKIMLTIMKIEKYIYFYSELIFIIVSYHIIVIHH